MIDLLRYFTVSLFDLLRYDFVIIPCLVFVLFAFTSFIKSLIKGG